MAKALGHMRGERIEKDLFVFHPFKRQPMEMKEDKMMKRHLLAMGIVMLAIIPMSLPAWAESELINHRAEPNDRAGGMRSSTSDPLIEVNNRRAVVKGKINSETDSPIAIRGMTTADGGAGVAGYGYHTTTGVGTFGEGTDKGIYGYSLNGWGGFFQGKLYASGNVGIGTTNPSQKLDVDHGNILVQGVNSFATAGDEAVLYLGDTNHYIKSNHSNYVQIGTWGTNKTLTITQSGMVGMLMHPLSAHQTALQLEGAFLLKNPNNQGNCIGTDTDGKLVFYRGADLTTPWVYIDDDTGNVGIGETNPVDPLHIVADAGGDNIYLEENSGSEYWQIGVDYYGDLNFKEGGTQRITFHDGGQVGIGDPPSLGGYMLVVNGHAAGTSWTNLSSRDYKKVLK